eukprot:Gregarina_sp_Pseudo_9__2727@NODE_296_length_3256_cov_24_516941_g277_i0_p1_GENE_NODE_296_length_3256_cov_24_516941_g277_i0NODE_296_length_3256_cov_24_516941_g277_i0_p1_ORF_typecomplete_len503_score144_22NTF2/PF02136_20/0_0012SnoaL_4/PF13577_6/0_055_NODE_296_length_3256_cov_24_516941_g277_i016463154
MHFYAGDTRQASMSSLAAGVEAGGDGTVLSTGSLPVSRQSRVIKIAERLLQDYYTRLSTDPNSLAALYLEDAEVIYTGKELNVDAVYACGRAEIEDFFRSDVASKFRSARVVVDALHPQASPTSYFGISLFAKGRLFLSKSAPHPAASSNYFVQTPYVHFVSLAPPAKPGNWGEIPPLYIANEYFHLLNLNLSPPSRLSIEIPPSSSAVLRSSEPPPAAPAGGDAVSAAAPAAPLPSLRSDSEAAVPAAAAPPKEPRAASGHRWSQDRVSDRVSVRGSLHDTASQRSTVHAQPGFPVSVSDADIVAALTGCIRSLGSGSCDSISKPRAQMAGGSGCSEFPFFFIHCDSPETAQLLLNAKNVHVLGQELRLSPQRSNANSRMHFPSGSGSSSWSRGFRGRGGNLGGARRPPETRSHEMGGSGESGVSQSPPSGQDVDMSHRPSLQRGGVSSSRGGPWVRRGGGGFGRSLRGGVSPSFSRKSVLVKNEAASRVSTSGDVTSPRN